jgi:choline dehydrogenase
MLNATVTKVLINPTTKKAEGVEFIRNGSKQTVKASKEVILAAGAINSPQVLLLSGVGPKQDLAKVGVPLVHDLKGVGQNLHNHVAVFINFILNQNATVDLDWTAATEYMLTRRGPLSSTGISQVGSPPAATSRGHMSSTITSSSSSPLPPCSCHWSFHLHFLLS